MANLASKKACDQIHSIKHDLEKEIKRMDSSDKCMALCIWATASVLMVGIVCLTVYHLKFVDSGLVQQIQDVSIPVKVWVKK